ncbi:fumarase, class II [Desulfatibacillum alkenivorans DSM 16219]|jgi:fumarate hydratase class II|uniref:Fumarate hydratase class II n=1 Tax=Desulfatibacillum alkenivorans DSM 16219 TaxID=1121393 RepID=A0A1M6VQG4_9BACT|nr:class II fumarate hydratase [Desulfatibacillum alkenivorans]SHK83797.1 fumarase, class II [Desulfatibacillum alkenivorans DSM 16219]
MNKRREEDSLGPVWVAEDAYYGSQTQRAVENFPISSTLFPHAVILAMVRIKRLAAGVHQYLDLLPAEIAEAIVQAAQELESGAMNDQFPVDVYQTGSGTSSNMNVNEVLAGRANEILTGKRGGKHPVHPNDHVNLGQSSNDVVPSAVHIACLMSLDDDLLPALKILHASLEKQAKALQPVLKTGRTHFMDALPVRMGQEFGGYARQVELGMERIQGVYSRLGELALGGTGVGTGLNAHPDVARRVVRKLVKETGLPFSLAKSRFEAMGARDGLVELSGVLKTLAVGLMKIASDIRLMASGPRCGIGEIRLPALQPGSSFMPGKVNPVLPESVLQVGARVIGNDATAAVCGHMGSLELNTMIPVLAQCVLESIKLLASSSRAFAEKCIDGLEADEIRCRDMLDQSTGLATLLVPDMGYDQAAELAREAHESGKTVRELAMEKGLLSAREWKDLLEGL